MDNAKMSPRVKLAIAVMANINMYVDSGEIDYLRKAIAEIRVRIEEEEANE